MKKVITFMLIMISLLVTGCDASLEIIGMDIEKYPNRIVYFLGVDNELDLNGGIVEYILKGGEDSFSDMDDKYITVSHNINFHQVGVYVVELRRNTATCKFPIEIIDIDKIKE